MDIFAVEISSNICLSSGPATTCPGTLVLVLLVGGHIERGEHQHMNVCICIGKNMQPNRYAQPNHLLSPLPDAETILAIGCPYVSVADSLATFNKATSDRPIPIAHIFTGRFCMCIAPKIFWKKPMGFKEEDNNKNKALIHFWFCSVGLYTKVVTPPSLP